MTKWDYKNDLHNFRTPDLELAYLKEMGSLGWELIVANITLTGFTVYYFKRPLE